MPAQSALAEWLFIELAAQALQSQNWELSMNPEYPTAA
jgi:hypothetical protein